jgi:hypothetical protein
VYVIDTLNAHDASLLTTSKALTFVTAFPFVLTYDNKPQANVEIVGVLEEHIQGEAIKYNSNRWDGKGFKEETTRMARAAQSLTCFSWYHSKQTSLLCDVQGHTHQL